MSQENFFVKTSPFSVKDIEAFEKELKSVRFLGKLELVKIGDAFILKGMNVMVGEVDVFDNDGEHVVAEKFTLVPFIREHLTEDQTVILTIHYMSKNEVLDSHILVFTKEMSVDLNLELAVKEKAIELGIVSRQKAMSLHLNH